MLLRRSSALFVDQENYALAPDRIQNWLAWLEDGVFDSGIKRRLAVKRVYWNATDEPHREQFLKMGFEVVYCDKFWGMKNGADIRMAMDIAELTLSQPKISEYILITSDSDFVPVLQRLKERKKHAVIVVNESSPTIHTIYREHAGGLIPRRKLSEAGAYVRPRSTGWGWWRKDAPTPPVGAGTSAVAGGSRSGAGAKPDPNPGSSTDANAALLDRAAACVVDVMSARPNQYTAQRTILLALAGVAGFSEKGAGSFLGQGSYKKLMKELARRDKRIKVTDASGGGTTVMYVPHDNG